MKAVVLLVLLAIVAFCLFHMWAEYRNSQHIPSEMRNSDDYKLAVEEAVADAQRLRFIEVGGAVLIFTLIGFVMAALKLRPAWSRSLAAAFLAWLATLVIFATSMETKFHNSNEKVIGTSMPFTAYETAIDYAAVGVVLAFAGYFLWERIHVWRVGQ
jgi:small-conductance mechanosensitive channel